ncbi:glycosyl hydrolase [Heyndrickxia coagulans]|uniref:glycosyl hydrolase n=1 Tax=Heyndrickxia coagulans TaxID=1398 RepID=UPI00216AFB87|nr:glycosyl hydrolase [Heyndrickxia coagulans]
MKNKTIFSIIILFTSFFLQQSCKEDAGFNSIYQAEYGTLKGVKMEKTVLNYSGSGYITDFNSPSDSVTFNVNVHYNGLYNLKIRYLIPTGRGDKRTSVKINGISIGEIVLLENNKFSYSNSKIIRLKKGMNKVTLYSNWGFYAIDNIEIGPAKYVDTKSITNKLVNQNATTEAKSLMNFIVKNYGKKIISGQQNIAYVNWIQKITGKMPAIVGFDFIDYSPSRADHGLVSNQVEQAINWSREGGIVQFQWHWNAPSHLINWKEGFYTKGTSFNIKYALQHKDSEDYKLLLKDIDTIAEQLKKLQAANVPVLFRPLHEAEGGWFWWGAQGPEPAKELYILLFNRLTYYHKINNLIWIWNSSSESWYPGNKYVDIVSYDSYPNEGNYDAFKNSYERLVKLVNNRKVVTISENGPIPDPDKLIKDQAKWSWFLTWDSLIKSNNSVDHLNQVYNSSYVVTLDELPKL